MPHSAEISTASIIRTVGTATLATPLPGRIAPASASLPASGRDGSRFTVHLATHHGLCFGVRDAITQAESLAAEGPLTLLGELAHNPEVRARLARSGIVEADLHAVGSAPTARVMTTAHGAAASVQAAWRRAGHTVIDGACPLVRHAHRELATLIAKGCHPVIIGKAGHAEVVGLCTDHPGAAVVDSLADLAHIAAHDRYGVISHTTQPIAKVRGLVAELKRLHPHAEVLFRDTVCQPTKDRQRALVELIASCEVVIVVGGRSSNNTRELLNTCRSGGRQAHQVECADDLDPAWFAGIAHVGLTAGTSTLPETVALVQARLLSIATGWSGVTDQPNAHLLAEHEMSQGIQEIPGISPPALPPASRRASTETDLAPIAPAAKTSAPSLPPLPTRAQVAALPPLPPSPFAPWLSYYEKNRLNRREPAWTAPVQGPPHLIALIAKSLAHLQLGESGEGTVLLTGAARRYAADPDYRAALALFIAEEGEHARLLAKIVERLGGTLVHKHWTHGCFRVFRHAIGVRFELQILLIAEIVGTAFYRLLRKHGPDRVVSDVCDLLLTDEDQHLAFHRERFRVDQANWSRVRRFLWLSQLRFVLHCAGEVAWWDFSATVKALGGSRKDFFTIIDDELRKVVCWFFFQKSHVIA